MKANTIVIAVVAVLAGGVILRAQQRPATAPIPYTLPPDLSNVSYGPYERNVLDLWKAESDRPTPLLVYFHPGGFNHGDKSGIEQLDMPLLQLCLKNGISVVTANYRYVNHDVHLPVPMLDGARVVQFMRLHAKEWNIDPQEIMVSGGSSGGGISLWIGFHPDLANPNASDPVERQSSRVCAVGTMDAQASYDPWVIAKLIDDGILTSRIVPMLFGVTGEEMKTESARSMFAASSPMTYLGPGAPPTFLYYTHDVMPLPPANQNEMIHNPRFGEALQKSMDKLGIECILRTPKDYPAGGKRPFSADMVKFFIQHCDSLASR